MERRIYLDFNASTPIAPEAVEAMRPFLTGHYGNPSSLHWAGAPAKEAVERARGQVAGILGCDPTEVVFTSGGSEANNHAILGVFFANRSRGNHIVTTAVEHPATLEPCRFLERTLAARVTVLPVDRYGMVDPDDIRKAITPRTILVTVMHANNEVGTVEPVAEVARIAREAGIPFHTDAAQTVGKISTDVEELGVDLLSVAGHKVYAPKGIGALYIREGTKIEPFVHGAGHEAGRRAGTENVLLAVALGAACAVARGWVEMPQMQELRDRLWEGMKDLFGDRISLNGHLSERLPNTLNVNLVGRGGAEILAKMPGVAASTGSACHAGSVTLSPVLAAMGVPPEEGRRPGNLYTRYGLNPTIRSVEAKLASLEDAESALVFASGMAAESALFFTHGRQGIVCLGNAYGGTLQLLADQLPRVGIPTFLLQGEEAGRLDEVLEKERPGLVFFETPTNPTMEIFDIGKIAGLSHSYGALVAVDNLELFIIAPSLGGPESLATQPMTTTHFGLPPEERLKRGITDPMIRFSIGMESARDLIEDLKNALKTGSGSS